MLPLWPVLFVLSVIIKCVFTADSDANVKGGILELYEHLTDSYETMNIIRSMLNTFEDEKDIVELFIKLNEAQMTSKPKLSFFKIEDAESVHVKKIIPRMMENKCEFIIFLISRMSALPIHINRALWINKDVIFRLSFLVSERYFAGQFNYYSFFNFENSGRREMEDATEDYRHSKRDQAGNRPRIIVYKLHDMNSQPVDKS